MLMTISGKCSDMFSLTVGENHKTEFDYDGYVPSDLGIGSGDYIELTIDLETGQIQDWKPITVDEVKSACKDEDDDDWEMDIEIPTDEHLLEEAQIQTIKLEIKGVFPEDTLDFSPDLRCQYKGWWIRVLGNFQFHICTGDDPMDPDGVNDNEEMHPNLTSAIETIHASV